MSGKALVYLLLSFTAIFAAALYYFQVFAYYTRTDGLRNIRIGEQIISVKDYIGIDSETSGLKLRGCFEADTNEFNGLPSFEKATPLAAPFWFDCFDNIAIGYALKNGDALAFMAKENEKDGIDRIVVIFPNGRGYQWRQLNSKYLD